MDQPLDLSQRVSDNRKYCNEVEMEDEQVCEIPNCYCSRKHLAMLKTPRQSSYEANQHINYNIQSIGANLGYPVFSDSLEYKCSFSPEMPNFSQYHPKRRKMEIFKQKLARSTSDNDISATTTNSDQLGGLYQNYESVNRSASQPNNSPYNGDSSSSSDDYRSPLLQTGVPIKTVHSTDEKTQDLDSKESSQAHKERLPKKRAHARHLSFCNDSPPPIQNYGSRSPGCLSNNMISETQGSHMFIQPAGPLINNENCAINSWNYQHKPTVIKSPMKQIARQSETKILTEKEKSFNALKADIMREIDNEKDEEDISTFRKNFYKYCTTGAKAISSVMSDKHPGGIRMSALEYLISKSLLQRENTGFQKRNDRVHQIIRGEKPGKLCLMDMVELQVEIGLA